MQRRGRDVENALREQGWETSAIANRPSALDRDVILPVASSLEFMLVDVQEMEADARDHAVPGLRRPRR